MDAREHNRLPGSADGRLRAAVAALAPVLVGIAAITATAGSAPAAVLRYALIVGSNAGEPTSDPLLHAERDAAKVRDVLAELGEVPDTNLVLLQAPTAESVRAALDDFEARFAALEPGPTDTVVFILYYSGHGTSDFLELGGTRLPLAELRERLRESQAGVRLAILDSCFSGAMIRAKGGRRAPSFPLTMDDHFRSEGYAFMTSSSADERSQESDEVRGSFFTHYLTSGLRGGADFSGDGMVTLSEAYRYTYHQTLKQSALTGAGPQHPHFDYEIAGEGELVLSRLTRADASVQFPAGTNGEYLLYAPGSGTVLGEVTVADQPSLLVVPAGDYLLFERSGPIVLSAAFTVASGEVHVVDRDAMTPLSAEEYRLKGPLVYVVEPSAFALAPKFGYQGVFDATIRSELLAPTLLWGVEGLWQRVGGVSWLTLSFDLLFAVAEQDMGFGGFEGGGSQSLFQLNFGPAALATWRFGDFALSGGPRVAFLYLRRDVKGDVIRDTTVAKGVDDGFTASPQALLRFSYRPVDWFAATLEGRAGWLRLPLNDAPRDAAYGEAFLALEFYP